MSKKTAKSINVEDLKNSLQEAEIIRTCARIALMNPALDPELKGDYEIACMRLNAEIRDLKMRMDHAQKRLQSSSAL